MCGLAGLVTEASKSEKYLESLVRDMAGTLQHRGPDDEGCFADADAGVALGFRRLAILDLSAAGHQPMRSESGRYIIAFNGEVYNFRELRRELSTGGARFRSESDTEVILAAFERWGIRESLNRFVGMFAFAVWDNRSRTLTLARDRMGIKPLFVYAGDGVVAFASELKALCRLPDFPRRLDHDALASYLRYLYVPSPDSIFQDTHKLPSGHVLTLPTPAPNRLPESEPYWSVENAALRGIENRFEGTPDEAVERLDELIQESVRLRTVADVPVGALFSGGIDSTSVVAAMQAASSQPVKTFTVSFDSAEHDESGAARAVSHHLGTDHTELEVRGEDALDLVPRLPEMFDEPMANPSQIPTHLVCRLAKRHVTVGLAGDGGDELFGGYNRYLYGTRLLPVAGAIPGPLRRTAAGAMGALSTETWDRIYRGFGAAFPSSAQHRLPGEKIAKFVRILSQDDLPSMYRSLLSACHRPADLLVSGREKTDTGAQFPLTEKVPMLLERMMLQDQESYLPGDLLAKVDRASMATSLEVRVPLLDHRIVEFSWRLPPQLKIRDDVTKWVLRRQLERKVPRNLWDRPKVGFTVPLRDWLLGPLSEWAQDLLSIRRLRHDGVFRPNRVQEMWNRFRDGETEYSTGLWAILMFQAWLEEWDVSTG